MKKVAARRIKTSQPLHFHPLVIGAITFCLGIVAVVILQQVFAVNNDFIIHSCVDKVNGNVRIVASGTSCRTNENPMDWNQQGPQGPAGTPGTSSASTMPFSCETCYLIPAAAELKGKDLSYSHIEYSTLHGSDLSGTIFRGGVIDANDFSQANLSGTDFSNTNYPWNNIDSNNFSQANLSGANFSNSKVGSNFDGANLSNANFTNTNLSSSYNMTTATLTGAIWSNTTCPDGTNSNNNGNTCTGHLH